MIEAKNLTMIDGNGHKATDDISFEIKPGEIVWAMDLGGENVTSEKLSSYLVSDIEKGGGSLKIVIGGSNGISPEVRARADRRLCFGNITLTHLMTRLVLAEQLYRGFKIAKGEKYHK